MEVPVCVEPRSVMGLCGQTRTAQHTLLQGLGFELIILELQRVALAHHLVVDRDSRQEALRILRAPLRILRASW